MIRPKREPLNHDNFLLLAAKWYDKTNCVMSEFEHDCHRIKYIKKLFKKYKKTGEIRERLILNHMIILGNVFGVEQSVRMLFLKIEADDWDVLKAFLIGLNRNLPVIYDVNGKDITTTGILIDMQIANKLRQVGNE
jgi:hypothetical protein